MIAVLEPLLPPIFAITAGLYLGLAVYVWRSSPQSIIAFFLLLIGTMIAGSAFSYGTQDPNLYGIGRTLSFFAGSFMPVAMFLVYRQYTDSPAGTLTIAILSIIPIATTGLALTNSMHQMIWSTVVTDAGIQFTEITRDDWFSRVHMPFAYGLFGFSLIALASRLPGIAPAHRRPVMMLLGCAILPFVVSIANTLVIVGPVGFPFLSLMLSLLLPVYAYVSVSMRVYEFSPIAYQTLFDHVRDPIIVLDNNQCVICANKKATEMLDTTEAEMLGLQLWADVPEARAVLNQAREIDLTQTLRLGSKQTYEVSVAPLLDNRGKTQGTVVVCRDVTERRKALGKLADSEHLIRTLIETSSNGILRFARDDSDQRRLYRCIFANRAAESYLSDGDSTLVGMPLEKLEQLDPQRLLAHFDDTDRPSSALSFETTSGGESEEGWLRIVGEPVGEDFSVTIVDITQRKRIEDKMLADALRDPLTGVLNRRGFEKEAATSVRSEERGAVLYLDLNQFKSINDRFGHQAGDALLKAFGHRLEFCLRPEDILGRLGGDEFAIVLPGVTVDDAKHIAERLVVTASEAYIIQGQEIKCAASVGISLMPKHGEELWHLISVADQAMYKVKSITAEEAANDRAAYVEAAIAS
ncbi:MAG: diguanylate cyclase [Gammaproteobacteria bacterium]|nr:diguanylate cyclase [Gammaproteobacteria bacterium]